MTTEQATKGAPGRRQGRFVAAVGALRAIRLYGAAAWIYLAGNSVSHPDTMRQPLTHLLAWPHENTAAVACFVASAVAFLALRVIDPVAHRSGDPDDARA